MQLETLTGDLRTYRQLEKGTFQHADQLTAERRTNPELRGQWIYTADGNIYGKEKRKDIWAITREPQNLVLQNLEQAFADLTNPLINNYFPDSAKAKKALRHPDTVIVDVKGLELEKDSVEYGHFVVDPKNVKRLNSQQNLAVLRIFGPDEANLAQNMETFAQAGKSPYVFVLLPSYVNGTLASHGMKYLGRASWLGDDISFYANSRSINLHDRLRGVRRGVAAGDAPKNQVPSDPREELVRNVLEVGREFIHPNFFKDYEAKLKQRLKF